MSRKYQSEVKNKIRVCSPHLLSPLTNKFTLLAPVSDNTHKNLVTDTDGPSKTDSANTSVISLISSASSKSHGLTIFVDRIFVEDT